MSFRKTTILGCAVAAGGVAALLALPASGSPQVPLAVLTKLAPVAAMSALAAVRSEAPPAELPGVAAPSGPYSAPAGTRITYRLRYASGLAVQQVDADRSVGPVDQTSLEATLAVTVLARDPARRELIARLRCEVHELRLPRAADDVASCRRLLGAGVLIRMSDVGAVLGLRFATADTLSDDRNLMRGLLTALRCQVPAGTSAGAEWQVDEPDLTGVARVQYTAKVSPHALDVRREVLGYQPQHGTEIVVDEVGAATFDATTGWWTSARLRSEVTAQMPHLQLAGVERTTLLASLLAADRVTVDHEAGLWAAPWAALTPAEPSDLALRQATERLTRAAAGVDLQQLLDELARHAERDDWSSAEAHEAIHALVGLLTAQPTLADEVTRRALDADTKCGPVLLAALGMAGTPQAQTALLTVVGDAHHGHTLRSAAAASLGQLGRPTEAVATALWRASRNDAGHDAETADAALLALGAITQRLPSPAVAPTTQRLLAAGARARSAAARISWLEALGNAGLPATWPLVEAYLHDPDPSLRIAAVGAVRKLSGAQPRAALHRLASDDANAAVRARAQRALQRRHAPQ